MFRNIVGSVRASNIWVWGFPNKAWPEAKICWDLCGLCFVLFQWQWCRIVANSRVPLNVCTHQTYLNRSVKGELKHGLQKHFWVCYLESPADSNFDQMKAKLIFCILEPSMALVNFPLHSF